MHCGRCAVDEERRENRTNTMRWEGQREAAQPSKGMRCLCRAVYCYSFRDQGLMSDGGDRDDELQQPGWRDDRFWQINTIK